MKQRKTGFCILDFSLDDGGDHWALWGALASNFGKREYCSGFDWIFSLEYIVEAEVD